MNTDPPAIKPRGAGAESIVVNAMTKTFRISAPVSVKEMFQLIGDMREVLGALARREIPNAEYTLDDLRGYCESLVKGQRGSLGRTKPDSWSVAENDDGMDSDCRVDFIFMPTYVAVATLARVRVDYPEIAAAIPGYDDSLRRGMVFATYRGLEGHGYDADRDMIKAVSILADGGVPEFLASHRQFCPALLAVLRQLKSRLTEAVASERTFGPWGADYREGYLAVLDQLKSI